MPNPWSRQRQDGKLEPMLWFERFTAFRLMGPGRSILESVNRARDEKGQNRSNNVPGSWRRIEAAWNWRARVDAWDVAEHERVKLERVAEREEWSRNRLADARALRRKALELLELPVISTTTEDFDDNGNPIIIEIKGLSGRLAEVGRVFKTADDLARITTGEPLPVVKQDINAAVTIFDQAAWAASRQSRLDAIENLDDTESGDGETPNA